jgi:phosphoesterase RecJ-like protein
MMTKDNINEQICQKVAKAKNIVVISHQRPDGDAVGSVLAIGLALEAIDKDVQMILEDGVPINLRFLPGSEKVSHKLNAPFDLLIALDCSDKNRLGNYANNCYPVDINIDHHITNDSYASINLIQPDAVSTTEIIAANLGYWGLHIDQKIAECLLTGIITDTIGFRTNNMRPEALRVAARLMEFGANLADLQMLALHRKSFEAIRFWGEGLKNLERSGGIIWTTISMAERLRTGYPGRDDADLINVLSTVEDAIVSLIFVEQPSGKIKVSWRSMPTYDVSKVAQNFGGGGHPSASGAEIEGDMEMIKQQVIESTKQLLLIN